MKKQFVLNMVLLFVINLLVKPFYVFSVETDVQNLLGTQTFGMYFYHLNFVFLFQFIGDFGLQTWNHQFISKNREKINFILPNVMATKALLSLMWLTCVLAFSWFISDLASDMLFLITLNVILSTLFILIRSFISGLGYYTTDSLLSALDKLLMIVVLSYLMYFGVTEEPFTLNDFIYGQMFSLILANGVALVILLQHLPSWGISGIIKYFQWHSLWDTLQKCAPYALILFLMMSYNKLDGFLLGFLQEDNGKQAGIYAASYRIYDAANMFLYMVPALVLPMFSNMYSLGNEVKSLVDMVVRWLMVITGPVLILSVFYAEEIIQLLYIEHVDEKVISFQFLMFSFLLVSFGYIFGALALAGDKVNKLVPVFFTGLLVNFLLNVFLIPKYGAKGAAISTTITQFWVLVGQVFIIRKYLFIAINRVDLGKGIVFMTLIFVFARIITWIWPESTFITFVSSAIFSVPLAFLLKLADLNDVRMVFNKKNNNNQIE
ncbi:MAG: polysaccharide biosynthesis C-terminal domain-containing protein [Saprospiraceae bacterium]|nr:polysaccharide biosynthesis C-terminal domain-containing protein [Saprospiraceae bacterium]